MGSWKMDFFKIKFEAFSFLKTAFKFIYFANPTGRQRNDKYDAGLKIIPTVKNSVCFL
jgi:hypothetical protein